MESHGRLAVGRSCGSRGPGSQLKEGPRGGTQ